MKFIKLKFLLMLFVGLDATLSAQESQQDSLVVLQNISVIDGLGNAPVAARDLIIQGGRILSIGPTKNDYSENHSIIDLTGHYIMPGIIDSHVHLLPSRGSFRQSNQYLLDKLEHALLGGITGLREMGGDARFLAPFKRSAWLGQIPGPDLYYATLMAGPEFFKDPRAVISSLGLEPGTAPWMPMIDSTTNISQTIAAARGSGATGIKLYLDLDADQVKALTQEAHQQGLKVWAHPYLGPATGLDLVEAGVDALSHSGHLLLELKGFEQYRKPGFWEYQGNDSRLAQLFREMKKNGTFLEPTIFVYDVLEKLDLPTYYNDSSTYISNMITREAYEAGVPLLAGTDTLSANPTDPYPHIHKEMRLMAEGAGIPPLEVIKAATYNGARNLGIANDYGSIEEGKMANLVILRENPADNIRNTQSIYLVIKRGRFFYRQEE